MRPADPCSARCPLAPRSGRFSQTAHHKQPHRGLLRDGAGSCPPLFVGVAKVRPQRPGRGRVGGAEWAGHHHRAPAGTAPPARHGRPLAATRGHGGGAAEGQGRGDRDMARAQARLSVTPHSCEPPPSPSLDGAQVSPYLQLPASPGQGSQHSLSGAPSLILLWAL